MGINDAINLLQSGILQVLKLAGPVLLVALVIGLIVALLQSITSIQEQTMPFFLKFLFVFLTIAILGGWMINSLMDYTINLFQQIPRIAG